MARSSRKNSPSSRLVRYGDTAASEPITESPQITFVIALIVRKPIRCVKRLPPRGPRLRESQCRQRSDAAEDGRARKSKSALPGPPRPFVDRSGRRSTQTPSAPDQGEKAREKCQCRLCSGGSR